MMDFVSKVCTAIDMVGFHCWGGAPEDVAYLGHRHRHVFHFRIWFSVDHDDRDVEFHQAQRRLRTLLLAMYPSRYPGELEFGGKSCEMIAREIAVRGHRLSECGQTNRVIEVEVWEDRENGAQVKVV